MMPLTDSKARTAKPQEKVYRLADQQGLCLEVRPTGGKFWRYRYRFQGKEKMLALGEYPAVGLAQAREKHQEARKLLSSGQNPSKPVLQKDKKITFKKLAIEWIERESTAAKWTPGYKKDTLSRISRHVFPYIGDIPISDISVADLLVLVKALEKTQVIDTGKRMLQKIASVYRYAMLNQLVENDPTTALKGILPPKKKKHYACITDPRIMGQFLRAIDSYGGVYTTVCALKLLVYLFPRPSELRQMKWGEIDFETRIWRVPAERMKMEEEHLVPLAPQVMDILNEMFSIRQNDLVFPSLRDRNKPICSGTFNAAFKSLGYSGDVIVPHGCRGTASTFLNEMGFDSDHIEIQLSHSDRDEVRKSYNHAKYVKQRRKMMEAYANYLDNLRDGGVVVPFKSQTG